MWTWCGHDVDMDMDDDHEWWLHDDCMMIIRCYSYSYSCSYSYMLVIWWLYHVSLEHLLSYTIYPSRWEPGWPSSQVELASACGGTYSFIPDAGFARGPGPMKLSWCIWIDFSGSGWCIYFKGMVYIYGNLADFGWFWLILAHFNSFLWCIYWNFPWGNPHES